MWKGSHRKRDDERGFCRFIDFLGWKRMGFGSCCGCAVCHSGTSKAGSCLFWSCEHACSRWSYIHRNTTSRRLKRARAPHLTDLEQHEHRCCISSCDRRRMSCCCNVVAMCFVRNILCRDLVHPLLVAWRGPGFRDWGSCCPCVVAHALHFTTLQPCTSRNHFVLSPAHSRALLNTCIYSAYEANDYMIGNLYEIKNVANKSARLFFAQGTEMVVAE